MTTAQLRARRAQGLCYYCDDKFVLGHRCPNKALLMMIDEEIDDSITLPELEPTTDTVDIHLSL